MGLFLKKTLCTMQQTLLLVYLAVIGSLSLPAGSNRGAPKQGGPGKFVPKSYGPQRSNPAGPDRVFPNEAGPNNADEYDEYDEYDEFAEYVDACHYFCGCYGDEEVPEGMVGGKGKGRRREQRQSHGRGRRLQDDEYDDAEPCDYFCGCYGDEEGQDGMAGSVGMGQRQRGRQSHGRNRRRMQAEDECYVETHSTQTESCSCSRTIKMEPVKIEPAPAPVAPPRWSWPRWGGWGHHWGRWGRWSPHKWSGWRWRRRMAEIGDVIPREEVTEYKNDDGCDCTKVVTHYEEIVECPEEAEPCADGEDCAATTQRIGIKRRAGRSL